MNNNIYMAIDVGATTIKWAVVKDFKILSRGSAPTRAHLPGEQIVKEVMFNIVDEQVQLFDINAIAISSAGTIDVNNGIVVSCTNTMPKYAGTNLKEMFEHRYNLPVSVENDANSNALFEISVLEDKNVNALFVTIGTGVGSAIIINSNLYRGTNFLAGEIGRVIVNNMEVDEYFSTRGLVNKVHKKFPFIDSGLKVFENICNNEVKQIVDQHILELSTFIKNLNALLDVDYVIIGGAISSSQYFIESLQKHTALSKFKLLSSSKGNDANLFGAIVNFEQLYN